MHEQRINAALDGTGPPLHAVEDAMDRADNLGVDPRESAAAAREIALPHELPPRAQLTSDPAQWEQRSRPCTEREAKEEVEGQRQNGALG